MKEKIEIDLKKLQELFNDGDSFKIINESIIRYWTDGCYRDHEQDRVEFDKLQTIVFFAQELPEEMANLVHKQWSHWMKYFFKQCSMDLSEYPETVGLFVKKENVDRWLKQMKTPYKKLTEKEKDSDREWAKKILNLIKNDYTKELDKAKRYRYKSKNLTEKIKSVLRSMRNQSFNIQLIAQVAKCSVNSAYTIVGVLYKNGLITKRKNLKKPYNMLYKWKITD